jgi:hypothetical protein
MDSPEVSTSPSAERDGYLIGLQTPLPRVKQSCLLGLPEEGWKLSAACVRVFYHVNGCLCPV